MAAGCEVAFEQDVRRSTARARARCEGGGFLGVVRPLRRAIDHAKLTTRRIACKHCETHQASAIQPVKKSN